MKIRFVQKKDIEQLVKLCELHAIYEKSTFDSENIVALLSKHIFNKNDILKCLIVEHEEEIVGYATFMKQFSTWDAAFYIYLDCLFFTENARGKGLGSLLMKEIKNYAKSENCNEIQWQTPDFNTKAIQFYQKLGATSKNKERFFWDI